MKDEYFGIFFPKLCINFISFALICVSYIKIQEYNHVLSIKFEKFSNKINFN